MKEMLSITTEKNLKINVISQRVIYSCYKKNYGQAQNVEVEFDQKNVYAV